MSDLQIVLIVIGGIIIAGVLIFNWWQERKFHQQVEKNFSAFDTDSVIDAPTANTDDLRANLDKFDDQNFSINEHDFNEDLRSENLQAETPSNENLAHSTEPVINFDNAVIEIPEPAETISPQLTIPDEAPKSSKHNDIKAIIEDAFRQDSASKETQVSSILATPEAEQAVASEATFEKPQSETPNIPDALHSQVDLVALLYLQGAASVTDVLNALKDGFEGYDKPTFVHVQTETGWLFLTDIASKAEYANQAISKISCSIQLADRAGPITRGVLNRFQLAVESMGLDMNAHVEWQSTSDALTDANALDAFCIAVDKTMGFHLLHGDNGAFTGTKLRGLAEAQGLELAADGSFKYYDAVVKNTPPASITSTIPSFVMFNRDHNPFSAEMLRTSVVKSITFQLDIPHVTNCIEAFNQMVLVAKQMETGLNAQLVDDNNRALSDVQIEKIRHQLKIIQATMLTKGITPGSDCAHRLFS